MRELDVPPLSAADELYARPSTLKVFVSSRMRGGVLSNERTEAAAAIESIQNARAWYWERDAQAGPYSSVDVCVRHARTSDLFVLLLGRDLTPVTRQEFEAANEGGAACFIFLKAGVPRTEEVRTFVEEARGHAITVGFQNLSELRTRITRALLEYTTLAVRLRNFQNRAEFARRKRASQPGPGGSVHLVELPNA